MSRKLPSASEVQEARGWLLAGAPAAARDHDAKQAVRVLIALLDALPASFFDAPEVGGGVHELPREPDEEHDGIDPSKFTIPGGRDKGKRLTEVDVKSLRWWGNAITESIMDPAKARFLDKNKALAAAIATELGRRGER